MSKTGEIPYTWAQIEEQVREAILCQASILEAFGPWNDGNLVADYLGLDRDSLETRMVEDVDGSELDISQHQITVIAKIAYDYAYQLGGDDDCTSQWHDVDGLLQGFPQTAASGEPSPFCKLNEFPLRRMLETFFARYGLFGLGEYDEYKPSVRELALLANMTVPAVRTSLSKEGFKLEKTQGVSRANRDEASFKLNAEDAKLWLSRRRGFIPQRIGDSPEQTQRAIDDALTSATQDFPAALTRIMALRNLSTDQIAVDAAWLSALIDGQRVAADLDTLRILARHLNVPEPDFVASGIRHILAQD